MAMVWCDVRGLEAMIDYEIERRDESIVQYGHETL